MKYYQLFIDSGQLPRTDQGEADRRELCTMERELRAVNKRWKDDCRGRDYTTPDEAHRDVKRVQAYALKHIGREFPADTLHVDEYSYII